MAVEFVDLSSYHSSSPFSSCWERAKGRRLVLSILVVVIIGSRVADTASSQNNVAPDCPAEEDGWMSEISSKDSWRSLALDSDDMSFVRTEGVKFVADLVRHRVYFLDMNRWENHYPFAEQVLGEQRDAATFNRQVYSGKDRSMVLGTLVRYFHAHNDNEGDDTGKYTEEYTFELSFRETLFNPEPVCQAFDLVRGSVFFASKLAFYPTNPSQLGEIHVLWECDVPITLLETITTNLAYQPLTLGVAVGTVRVIDSAADVQKISKLNGGDIAVFRNVPDELQPTAALVTFRLQTPLCHVALLCRNRKTPNMSIQLERNQQLFEMYKDTTVRVEVRSNGFTLEKISSVDLPQASQTHNVEQSTLVLPIANDSFSSLLSLNQILEFKEAATIVGAKAAQFAHLAAVEGATNLLSSSFAVPFSVYLKVIRTLDLSSLYDTEYPVPADVDVAKSLTRIRENILSSAHLPQTLVSEIIERTRGLGWRKVIFRSSTNVEDLPGFNGAGLYDSIVVHDVRNHQLVSDALLGVFASMWTYPSWSERAAYGIDQRMVAMAVLIQPFLGADDENGPEISVKANGVALTAAPPHVWHRVAGNRDPQMSFYVNALLGSSHRVTESQGPCTPEELILHVPTLIRPMDIQLLAASSCGESVLTRDDASRLTNVFSRLHSSILGPHYVGDKSTKMALDIEFLIVQKFGQEGRDVEVLQARPIDVS